MTSADEVTQYLRWKNDVARADDGRAGSCVAAQAWLAGWLSGGSRARGRLRR